MADLCQKTEELADYLATLTNDQRIEVINYRNIPVENLIKPTEAKAAGYLRKFQEKYKTVPSGSRNIVLFKYSTQLRRCGLTEPAILDSLWQFSYEHCKPPYERTKPDDVKELSRLARNAAKFIPIGFPKPAISQKPDDLPYDYNNIADDLRNKEHVLSYKKTLFRYKDGVYTEDEGYLDSLIVSSLIKRGIEAKDKVTIAAAQVRHYLTYGKVETEYPFNIYPDAVPVRNGILKINFLTGETELLPFSPEYRFNYRLNVSFDKSADGTMILKYLESLGTDIDILVQIPAHAILGMLGRVYKKAYFLQGSKNSGKSTYIDLITRHLFGISVCSSVTLQALLFDRFRLAELDGKIVNAYSDLSDQKLRDIGLFKTLTGGDLFTVERKHRDPYQMRNKALLLFSANKYPKITTGDDAFWDRWIALEFNKIFTIDTTFADRTFTDVNLSGFLNLVLIETQEIIKDGKIKVTDSVENKWLNDASSCHRFIHEHLERSTGAVLIKGIVYSLYVQYCKDGEYEAESPRALTDAMIRNGALSRQMLINKKSEHCYQGYKMKGMDPVLPDIEKKESTQMAVPGCV